MLGDIEMQSLDVKTGVEQVEIEPLTITVNDKYISEKNKLSNYAYLFTKRLFDIIGSIIGIVVLIPVTFMVYIARIILRENDGSLFYSQLRYGKNGKMFRLYKFRSMCKNADEKLKKYLEENEDAKKEFEESQKLTNDPRITKLGKFLRKTSIDELPQ